MRLPKPLRRIAVALILFQIIMISQVVASQVLVVNAASEVSLEVKYTVQVRDGGLVVINAMIDLRNEAAANLSSLEIGFSKNFEQDFDDCVAFDSQESELSVVREGVRGDVFWLDVGFAEAVEQGQTLKLSIFFVFSRLVIFDDSTTTTLYAVVFPSCPVLPFDASRCEVEIILPRGAAAQTSSLSGLLKDVKAPLKANSNQVGFVSFTGDIRILECNRVNREVVVDPWGSIYFYDSYTLQNIGKATLQDMTLRLPLNAEEVTAYDTGGPLTTTLKDLEDAKEVKVRFRYPLRGKEGPTAFNDVGAFTVRYKVSSRSYLASTGSWLDHRLSISMSTSLNLTIRSLMVRVTLPEGAKYQSSSHSGAVSVSGITPSIDYVFKNITPVHFPGLKVGYGYLALWAALRPALWIGGVAAVISAVTLYRRRVRRPLPVVSDRRQRLFESFTVVCDERMMAWSEIDSLEESLDNKRMGRRDYNRRKRIIQQRLRSLDGALTNLKNGVRQIEPRYAERIDRLGRAEAEVAALRDNIEGLRVQYRSGKMSRRTFTNLKDDYEKRVGRAKRVIESIIIEFRGDIAS